MCQGLIKECLYDLISRKERPYWQEKLCEEADLVCLNEAKSKFEDHLAVGLLGISIDFFHLGEITSHGALSILRYLLYEDLSEGRLHLIHKPDMALEKFKDARMVEPLIVS